jgi:hypothetical protein
VLLNLTACAKGSTRPCCNCPQRVPPQRKRSNTSATRRCSDLVAHGATHPRACLAGKFRQALVTMTCNPEPGDTPEVIRDRAYTWQAGEALRLAHENKLAPVDPKELIRAAKAEITETMFHRPGGSRR